MDIQKKKMAIIWAEDNENTRSAIATILTEHFKDYRIYPCADGEEGMRCIDRLFERNTEISLILSDEVMTGQVYGRDLLDYRKAELPHTARILITGQTTVGENAVVDCIQRGFNDFIRKPVDANELLFRIHSALDKQKTKKGFDILLGMSNKLINKNSAESQVIIFKSLLLIDYQACIMKELDGTFTITDPLGNNLFRYDEPTGTIYVQNEKVAPLRKLKMALDSTKERMQGKIWTTVFKEMGLGISEIPGVGYLLLSGDFERIDFDRIRMLQAFGQEIRTVHEREQFEKMKLFSATGRLLYMFTNGFVKTSQKVEKFLNLALDTSKCRHLCSFTEYREEMASSVKDLLVFSQVATQMFTPKNIMLPFTVMDGRLVFEEIFRFCEAHIEPQIYKKIESTYAPGLGYIKVNTDLLKQAFANLFSIIMRGMAKQSLVRINFSSLPTDLQIYIKNSSTALNGDMVMYLEDPFKNTGEVTIDKLIAFKAIDIFNDHQAKIVLKRFFVFDEGAEEILSAFHIPKHSVYMPEYLTAQEIKDRQVSFAKLMSLRHQSLPFHKSEVIRRFFGRTFDTFEQMVQFNDDKRHLKTGADLIIVLPLAPTPKTS